MSKGGGGGGGTQTTVSEPWKASQPYLLQGMRGAQAAYQNPPQFYPGQTFVGPTPGELAAWGNRLNYADQVFGGAQAPQFGDATQALQQQLTGQNALGSLAGTVGGLAGQQLSQGLNPFGQAGSLDARGAIGQMLTGQPDYSGLQGAIDAANAPILRQFEQDILPGLAQRASFLNNPTGGIKTLNRVLPEIGSRMSENAQALYQAERNRALGERAGAANLVSQGGLSMNQGLLGLGGLAGQLGAQMSGDQLRALGLFPTIAQTGAIPGDLGGQFAQWGRGFQEQALGDQMDRFNYYQQLPWQQAQNYLGLVSGMGGLGGSSQATQPGGSMLAGAAGGALTGGMLGSMAAGTKSGAFLGPWGAIGGAALGGLLGAFG